MKHLNIIEVKPQGYCGGVLKAIDIAKQTRQKYPDQKITILGNLVHNDYVKKSLALLTIDTLEIKGKTRTELLDSIDEGIVIFTAHGVSQQVYDKAIKKKLQIVDASCPFVLQTQKLVKQKLNEGFDIFYIGKNQHPEAESIYTLSQRVHLIDKAETIPIHIKNKIFVTNQTTMSLYDIQSIFENIKKIYPDAIIHDEICNATRVRQQALLDLSDKNVDVLIVVGDPTSNNTKQLANIGIKANIPKILRISDVTQLDIHLFKENMTVAVTSGASTPTYLTKQVLYYLQHNDEPRPEIQIEEIL